MRLKRSAPPPRIEATLDAGAKPGPEKRAYKGRAGSKAKKFLRHQITPESRKMIANMASYGLDVITIGRLSGLSTATIYKYYRHEMMTAAANKDLIVLQSAFLKAIGGPEQNWEKADAAQQRWWIACRQRWSLPADRSINANLNMDLSRLTDRQLDELERILEAAALDDRGHSAGEIIPPEQAD